MTIYSVKKRYNHQGFLLIEALGAIALSVCLSFLVAHYQATVLIWYHNGLRRLQALTFASNSIESGIKPEAKADSNIFTITRELIPMDQKIAQKGFQLSKVTVSWRSMQGVQEAVSFYTGSVHGD
jgi:hypothetical protein